MAKAESPALDKAALIVEASLLSSTASWSIAEIEQRVPFPCDIQMVLARLQADYRGRSFCIVTVNGRVAIRTRPECSDLCRQIIDGPARLSRAAHETLMIIAYFQPVTRAEIEKVRGVSLGRGTLDSLIHADLIKPGQRRLTHGRPMTFITTLQFLEAFDFSSLDDLPDLAQMQQQGLIDARRGVDIEYMR